MFLEGTYSPRESNNVAVDSSSDAATNAICSTPATQSTESPPATHAMRSPATHAVRSPPATQPTEFPPATHAATDSPSPPSPPVTHCIGSSSLPATLGADSHAPPTTHTADALSFAATHTKDSLLPASNSCGKSTSKQPSKRIKRSQKGGRCTSEKCVHESLLYCYMYKKNRGKCECRSSYM